MHSVAIKALKEEVRHLECQFEASYDEVWTPAGSDRREEMLQAINSLKMTIEFLESVK